MEAEIRGLERRAFASWEQDFTPSLMMNNKLIRIGCATFTPKRQRHTDPKVFQSIIDRYFYGLAKKQQRHFVWLFGQTAKGAKERLHQHGDIFIFYKEGAIKDAETYRWLLETSWRHGICEIEPKGRTLNSETGLMETKGNWTGYSVQKHDGNDDFLKIYCPKTGACGNQTKRKGDRRFCVYQRHSIKVK
jgi:hypothetical protein